MRKYALISLFLLVALNGVAQKRMGLVLNPQGQGIAHVSIQDGKSIQLSDALGFFNLNTEAGNYQFSHVAYSSKVVEIPAGRDTVTVVLYPLQQELDTVTVFHTGYSNIPKERATGSFAEITRADLDKRLTTNILENLDGMAPGLQYDRRLGHSTINIRGINTLSPGLLGPLIILDNFPYEGDISRLNPEDIASVTLLKDAAAASIWGARAGNGVIVIKTKKAQGGKLTVDASINTRYTEKDNLFYQPGIKSADFIAVERMLFEKGLYDAQWNHRNKKMYVFSPVVELLYKQQEGTLTEAEVEKQIASFSQHDYRNELLQYAYSNPFQQQYNVGIANGTERSEQRISLGYVHERMNRVGVYRDRVNVNWNSRLDITPKFRLSSSLLYSYQHHQSGHTVNYPISVGGGKGSIYPYARLMSDDGEPLAIPYMYNYDYVDTIAIPGLKDWKYRPLGEGELTKHDGIYQAINSTITLAYKVSEAFSLQGLYNIELNTNKSSKHELANSFAVRDLYNRYAYYEDGMLKSRIPDGDILQLNHGDLLAHRARGQLSYTKEIAQHRLALFAGAEFSDRVANRSASRHYGYDEMMNQIPVDLVTAFPIFDGLGGRSTIPSFLDFDRKRNRFVSFYANGAYDYAGRYILTASARRDASNLFGVKTNERWNPLWSTGFLWNVDKESFMRDQTWITGFQLKTTYGHSGNTGGIASSYPVIKHSNANPSALYKQKVAGVASLPNESLRWENVAQLNFGSELALLKNRVKISLDVFFKHSTDLLADDPLDPTSGFTRINRNVGELKGRGYDLQLHTQNLVGKFRWNSRLIFSKATSRVTTFYGRESAGRVYARQGGKVFTPVVDKMLYPVLTFAFKGLDPETGDPQGWYADEISTDYKKLLGDSLGALRYKGTGLPIYHGSFQHTFSYKGFELWTNLTFKFGHYFQRQTINYYELFTSWRGHVDFEKRWQEPGDERHTTVPSMQYPPNSSRDEFYAYSEANIDRGDLLRLQDIRLNYSYKPRQVGLFKQVSFFVNANNLGILWKASKSQVDPDYQYMPPERSYACGVRLAL